MVFETEKIYVNQIFFSIDRNFQINIYIFRSMPATSHHSNDCQSSADASSKLFLSEHFRLCKAKFQKRKFIQRQSKEQLGIYKQKMLRLVRKKSSQNLDEAEKRIASLEEEFKFQEGKQNIVLWIQEFEKKIQEWPTQREENIDNLVEECRRITRQIQARNNFDQCIVSQVADKIQRICLDSIYK